MKVQLIGCSHHNATVELRERLAFRTDQVALALDGLRRRFPRTEAVLLSTCNRVEVYTAAESSTQVPSHQEVVHFLADFHGVSPEEIFDDLVQRTDEDAVRHLFFVAASLDSMLVGEPQILGQVKSAYKVANNTGSTGPLTHAIFQAALKTARRVATETTINQRRTSIPGVAVTDVAKRIFERFDDKKILLIGAGDMANETLRYLRDEGAREIVIVNRDLTKAQRLAREWQGRAKAWEHLLEEIVFADVVISLTGSTDPIVQLAEFQYIESRRFQRPLAILDLAVPRDFDPAIGQCLGVYLYSIDDLREACGRNRAERERQWPKAEKIVEEESARFMADLNHRATAPTIKRLKETCQALEQEELARLFRKLPELDQPSRDVIRHAVDRLVNKMLHPPLESLRDEAHQGTSQKLLEALRHLFQLKD